MLDIFWQISLPKNVLDEFNMTCNLVKTSEPAFKVVVIQGNISLSLLVITLKDLPSGDYGLNISLWSHNLYHSFYNLRSGTTPQIFCHSHKHNFRAWELYLKHLRFRKKMLRRGNSNILKSNMLMWHGILPLTSYIWQCTVGIPFSRLSLQLWKFLATTKYLIYTTNYFES